MKKEKENKENEREIKKTGIKIEKDMLTKRKTAKRYREKDCERKEEKANKIEKEKKIANERCDARVCIL
jgi:hypothetical protein